MNILNKNILKAISEGIQKGLDFTLDDFNDSDDDLYIFKKEVSSASLNQEDKELNQKYIEKHPRIKVGDILYSNFERNEKGELLNLGNKEGKPIAVCGIQPDFLPDKEARFIAYDEFKAEWGEEKEIEELPCLDKVLTNSRLRDYGYLYSAKFNGYDSSNKKNISDPYVDVNKFNKEWLIPNQMLSDLQGWKNQEIILKEQGTSKDFACHQCYNYKTEGTNIGEWYLPSAGELGIMIAKFIGIALSSNDFYWTSTQYSSNNVCNVSDNYGVIDYYGKDYAYLVRPFFHITLASNFQNNQHLNESSKLDFTLNDFSDNEQEYISKKHINSKLLDQEDKQILDLADYFKDTLHNYLNKTLSEYDIKVFNDIAKANSKKTAMFKISAEDFMSFVWMCIDLLDSNANLNWIDTSKIDNMSGLFSVQTYYIFNARINGVEKIKKWNGDISDWDVSNVNSMDSMFIGTSFNGDISKWDVSSVTSMDGMFFESKFNGDISKWDVQNVDNMSNMFAKSKFNQDISKWNTSNCTSMAGMFSESSFNQDISAWDTSKVEYMDGMFYHNTYFNQDISNWDITSIITYDDMFTKCKIKEEYKPQF